MKSSFKLLLLFFLTVANAIGQNPVPVYFNSGTYMLELNADSFAFSAQELNEVNVYKIVHFSDLSKADRKHLKSLGVELLNYIPKNSFYARFNPSVQYDFAAMGIDAIHAIQKDYKLSKDLLYGTYPEHALAKGKLSVNIIPFEGKTEQIAKEVEAAGSTVTIIRGTVSVELTVETLMNIAENPHVMYIETVPPKSEPVNLPGKTSHGSSYLDGNNGVGLNFDGEGITLMMIDDGYIGPHIDFKNRADQSMCFNCNDSPSATHADHVAGTIMGAGNLDPDTKGMATGINFIVKNGELNEFALIFDAPNLYTTDSLVITSRSMHNGCGGNYFSNTTELDQDARQYRSLLHISAGANFGPDNCNGIDGWANMSNLEQAMKNGIAVGNLDRFDAINSSSSRGPLPDGRLKPDICGVGTTVNSTQPDNTYANLNGTSMSCPGVAGTTAQLYQAFKELNNGDYPANGLMKGILLNSANDLGNPGPDFIYGWGKINGRKAYNAILNQTYFIDTVATGQSDNIVLNIPTGVKEARVMLYWTDYESTASAAVNLVNNLDLTVTDPTSGTHLPLILDHTLDVSSLSAPAAPGIDTVNNVEQVRLIDPVAGIYSINVAGTAVPQGPQEYFVVYEFITDDIVVNYPNGGERLEDGLSEVIRWDIPESTSDFTIEFSTDNGASWNTLGTAPAADRNYSWAVQNGLDTKDALIRVSNGITSDESDNVFSIYQRPSGITVDWACNDSLQLSWTPVNNAQGYEVSMLGNMFMDSIGYTTVDSFVVYAPWTDTVWLSVVSYSNTGAISKRAIAISKEPGQFGCTWEAPLANFSVSCDTVSTVSCVVLENLTVNIDAGSTYTWYFPNGTPVSSNDEFPTVCFADTGYQSVALVAQNAVGTDSLWLDSVVYIISTESLTYMEGFEQHPSLLDIPHWSLINDGGFGFEHTSSASHSGQHSMFLLNFGQPSGNIDQVISGPIDLSVVDTSQNEFVTLSFRYAYRKRASFDNEILRLKVKGGCSAGWATRRTLSGSVLGSGISITNYIPEPEDWVTVHVTNITPQFFVSDFRFMFEFESDQGNNIFIDDINIYKGAPSDDLIADVVDLNESMNLSVYPNPATNELFIDLVAFGNDIGSIELTDLQGKVVYQTDISIKEGLNELTYNVENLSEGVYLLKVNLETGSTVKRIQVTK